MKRSLFALALLTALPFAASAADGISYNYVQGGYSKIDSDLDADGWAIKGSAAVAPNFHVFGSYSDHSTDKLATVGGGKLSLDQWELGVGYNRAISSNMDFVGTLAYTKADAKVAGISTRTDGYAAEAGVRGAMTPMFEGYAMAGYEDGNDYDGDFYGRLGTTVKFNPNWGVNADVKFASGDTQWFVGPRFTW